MATTIAAQYTTCRRCGRPLTSARSIREAQRNGGYGRGCAAKIEAEVVAADQPVEVSEKALELIEDGGLVRVIGSLFLAVSTDGRLLYEVCPVTGRCTCKASQYGRRCYHLAAAEAVSGLTAPEPAAPRESVELARPADPFACFLVDDDPFAPPPDPRCCPRSPDHLPPHKSCWETLCTGERSIRLRARS